MTKFFCCCIPVRFGVFVISLLGTLFSGLAAGALWWTLFHQGDANIITLQSGTKPAFIAEAVHFSIVAIASAVGLIGALGRKRALVAFYAVFLWGSLIVTAAFGGWSIYQVLSTFDDSVKTCKSDIKNDISGTVNNTLNGNFTTSTNGTTHNDCISAPLAKALYITIFVFLLLLMLYGTLVVHRYKNQLDDDDRWDARHDVANQSTKSAYSYAPRAESHPLSAQYQQQPHGYEASTPYHQVATGEDYSNYPYAAPQHSYGKGAWAASS